MSHQKQICRSSWRAALIGVRRARRVQAKVATLTAVLMLGQFGCSSGSATKAMDAGSPGSGGISGGSTGGREGTASGGSSGDTGGAAVTGGTTGNNGGGTGAGTGGGQGTTGGASGTGGRIGGASGTGGRTGGAVGSGGGATGGRGGSGTAGAGAAGRAGTGGAPAGGVSGTAVAWTTRTLLTGQVAEGADVGDINGDGKLDLVAGPVWFDGAKDFAKGGQVIPTLPTLTMTQYSLFFLTFVDDVNGDGRPDVIAIGDAGGANNTGNPNAFWYENPGAAGLAANSWTKHTLISGLVANESPAYLNVAGDEKKELIFIWCQTTSSNGSCPNGQLGYARPGTDPNAAWTFTPIGGSFSTAWVHGLGVGDVDKDGLQDVLERTGWWRQVSATSWERHAFDFWSGSTSGRSSNWGGAEMYVADVDGDGDNDVISVLAAHQYGLAWFEHQGPAIASTFVAHDILPASAGTNNISQLHAVAMADVNGDGLPDIITGKRYYAHDTDPGTTDAPILAWFEMQRSGATSTFVRHDINSASGVGCNFTARDLNGDGKVDVFTSSKRGTFLHLQQ
jgi:hypothetical protein